MTHTLKISTSKELMAEFARLLEDKTGLHFPVERFGDLEKKMRPMMVSGGFNTMEECLQWLMRNPLQKKQIHDLAYYLTIGETYFFRDPRMWNALETRIFPELLQRHARDHCIRIWSAGCCTGEEPYSIAMLLRCMLPDIKDWTVHLVGTDINQQFLRRAEAANYRKWSFRAISEELQAKYFERQKDGTFQLSPQISEMVKFVPLNLVEGSPDALEPDFLQIDLILCNNVLMYFSQPQVNNTTAKFVHALSVGGWLGVTGVEAPFISHSSLASHHIKGAAFFKKQAYPATPPTPPPPLPVTKSAPMILDTVLNSLIPPHAKPVENKSLYQECLELYRLNRYDEVISRLQAVPKTKDHVREMILLVRTYANLGNATQAFEWCESALRVDKLEPILHYLKAELQLHEEDLDESVKSLKRALFLDPDFVAAHYILGLLEERRGHKEASEREFRITLELVQDCDPDELLAGTEELTAGRVRDHLMPLMRRIL